MSQWMFTNNLKHMEVGVASTEPRFESIEHVWDFGKTDLRNINLEERVNRMGTNFCIGSA